MRTGIRQALSAQMDLAAKARLADYVIANNGSWAETRRAAVRLGEALEKRVQESA